MRRDRYLVAVASAVGLLCGFLWSDRPPVPAPAPPALTKQEKEPVPPVSPKDRTVRVSLEKETASVPIKGSKAKKQRPKVISRAYRVNQALVRSGMDLVGEQGEHLGSFPAVTANYRAKLGFKAYVTSLRSLGARFLVRDRNRRKLVAEVDFQTLYLNPVKHLQGLSPRSRIISGECGVKQYIDLASVMFGPGDYQMVVLLPLALDAALIGGAERALKRSGYNIKDFNSLEAIYKRDSQGLSLVVEKGFHKSGRRVPLNLHFNLESLSERNSHET